MSVSISNLMIENSVCLGTENIQQQLTKTTVACPQLAVRN